jgi:cobalt-zinc-cadmium efflux system protein
MAQDHDHHAHDHHGRDRHAHGHGPGHAHGGGSERALFVALILIGSFMLVEVAGGLLSGSLALLADAAHMLTDFAALAMAFAAIRVARRPADPHRTYGFDRVTVLAAFVNGLALVLLSVWIVYEAGHRLAAPSPVAGGLMLGVAVAGLLVNVAAFWILTRSEGPNLNLRAAALHVLGDLLGSVAAIAAALVILWTGWSPIDPILSVLVALLILRSAIAILRESGHILLEGTPVGFDTGAVARDLQTIPGVIRVTHLHAWSISEERPMATLEAHLEPDTDPDSARAAIKARLAAEHGIDHATVETSLQQVARESTEKTAASPA